MSYTKPKTSRSSNGHHAAISNHSTSAKKSAKKNKVKSFPELEYNPKQETLVTGLDGQLLQVLTEVKNGNFAVRMPIDQVG
ncbi:MAG TPA: hypothetical protein VFV08_10950, partial [Puia sp.]|nr:hypothetical protein [Puia sp.]